MSVHGAYFNIEKEGEEGFGYRQKRCFSNYGGTLIESVCFNCSNVSTLLSMIIARSKSSSAKGNKWLSDYSVMLSIVLPAVNIGQVGNLLHTSSRTSSRESSRAEAFKCLNLRACPINQSINQSIKLEYSVQIVLEQVKRMLFFLYWRLSFIFSACCSDIGYLCWIWKKTGRCVSSSDYAVNKCKKTCNFCPAPTGKLSAGKKTSSWSENGQKL